MARRRLLWLGAAVAALAACTPKEGFVIDKIVEPPYEWVATETTQICNKIGDMMICTPITRTYRYVDDEDYAIYLEDENGAVGHVYVPLELFETIELGGWFAGKKYPRYNHPRKELL